MWRDLTRDVLEVFVEAAGSRQGARLVAWEATRRRVRPTRGEVMVLSIAKKAEALGAVAKGIDGLGPEDALEVLGLASAMTEAKLGALASIVRDLAALSPEDRAEVIGWAETSIPLADEAHPARPRSAARAIPPSSPRPMVEKRRERLAWVESRGRVTMEEFRSAFGLTKTTACHWLSKATDDGAIRRESQGVYVAIGTASPAGGSSAPTHSSATSKPHAA